MAMDIAGIVGPQTTLDGFHGLPRLDRTLASVVAQGGGRYQEPALRGQLFTYSTPAAGVVLPIYNSTTQQCVLYNPLGNTKALVIKRVTLGYVSGTAVAGHFCYATQTLATNALTGTQSAIANNNKIGGNYNANGQNGQTGQLFTAATVVAMTYFRAMVLSQVIQSATDVNAPWIFAEEVDGSIALLPGGAIAVAGNAAAFVRVTVAFEVLEVPLAQAA
jgi:hypothetical protein